MFPFICAWLTWIDLYTSAKNNAADDLDDNIIFLIVIPFIVSIIIMLYMYNLYCVMTKTLIYLYKTDVHGLSSRLTTNLISGTPVLFILALEQIKFSYAFTAELAGDMCKYIPNATEVLDPGGWIRLPNEEGQWKNCIDQVDKYYPDTVITTNEAMLLFSISEYMDCSLAIVANIFQMIEYFLLILQTQVLIRVCRISMNDVIHLNVSKLEFIVAIFTILRLLIVVLFSTLSIEHFNLKTFRLLGNILQTSYLIIVLLSVLLIYQIVRNSYKQEVLLLMMASGGEGGKGGKHQILDSSNGEDDKNNNVVKKMNSHAQIVRKRKLRNSMMVVKVV